jgi:hypothetical protein
MSEARPEATSGAGINIRVVPGSEGGLRPFADVRRKGHAGYAPQLGPGSDSCGVRPVAPWETKSRRRVSWAGQWVKGP